MINEIFPTRVRGRGVAIATAVNWASAWLVSQFFLTLIDGDRQVGDVLAVRRVRRPRLHLDRPQVPETKGRTLEEIEQLWVPSHP